MKNIRINKIFTENSQYVVYLGNGTCTKFTNYDRAKQFISETNDFLTQQLYYINELHQLVYSFYREQWCFFQHNKQTSALRLSEIERYCYSTIHEIENCLDLAVNRSHWTNGNYFTFYHLQNALTGIKTILKELQPLCKNQSASDKLRKINFLFMVAAKIESDLNNYAYLGARLFKISIHDLNYTDEFKPALSKTTLKRVK